MLILNPFDADVSVYGHQTPRRDCFNKKPQYQNVNQIVFFVFNNSPEFYNFFYLSDS